MSGEHMPCPDPLPFCRYEEPYADTHHKYFPSREYSTPVEKRFRRLECNIVRGICRCLHDLEHLKQPPRKPSREEMLAAISSNGEPEHWNNWSYEPFPRPTSDPEQ